MTVDINDEQRTALCLSKRAVGHEDDRILAGFQCPLPASELYENPFHDIWTHSIHQNNVGIDHLGHGRLHEAWRAFEEANILERKASNLPTYDDTPEYRSNWVCIRSMVDTIASCEGKQRNISCIFLYGLRIGNEINDSSSDDSGQETPYTHAEIDVLRTPRIDWTISYNLGLTAQLLGIVNSGFVGMAHRADAFSNYTELTLDIVAWYDGLAPVDAALLMMAIHNNSGSIYRQLEVGYQVEAHWSRMRTIINASKSLREHSLCRTFRRNLEYLLKQRRPAAAA